MGSPGSRVPIWSTKWGKHRGGGLGLISRSKHRKKEPRKGQHLLDPGGRSSLWGDPGGAVEGWGREGKLGCVSSFLSFFCFVFVGSSLFSSFESFLYKGK